MGTNSDYFKFLRFAGGRPLQMSGGRVFEGVFDAVFGAKVAQSLDYHFDDSIVIAHGAGEISLIKHDDKPFKVVGILKKTGTPVDRTIHVLLQGIEAIHIDWKEGTSIPGMSISQI